jgi:hypothetical protein
MEITQHFRKAIWNYEEGLVSVEYSSRKKKKIFLTRINTDEFDSCLFLYYVKLW